jgi:hypothetical protein
VMLPMSLSYSAFIMLRYDPTMHSSIRTCIRKGCLILSKTSPSMGSSYNNSLDSIYVLNCIHWFTYTDLSLHPWGWDQIGYFSEFLSWLNCSFMFSISFHSSQSS